MLINWQAARDKQLPHLIVDIAMLLLASLHLIMLLFDTTYFYLRPTYVKWLPAVTRSYDPIKGIEPHRFTVKYQQEAAVYFESCQQSGEVSKAQQQKLIQLSTEMIDENPFERANLRGKLEIIKSNVSTYTQIDRSKAAFQQFWQAGCQNLAARQHFYETEIRPYLAVNFWRRIGTNGRMVNYFLYIDLCFISFFLLEFLISWIWAIRKQGREQRVLYPIYHWYDWVSCIPLQSLRILRLLRIGAIFYRLIRSDFIDIRQFRVYRSLIKYQNILMEEISDQVAINILTNIQAKTRLGTNRDLLEETLRVNRDKIRDLIVSSLQRVELPTLHTRQLELVDNLAEMILSSIKATEDYRQLASVPLVKPLMDQVINHAKIARLTEQSLDAFLSAWSIKIQSEEMQSILSDLVDDVLDASIELSLNEHIQQLVEDINIQILEELKESSTAKIWRAEAQGLLIEKITQHQQEVEPT